MSNDNHKDEESEDKPTAEDMSEVAEFDKAMQGIVGTPSEEVDDVSEDETNEESEG